MAKVYSWEVSKNPNKYAYIVSPKDYTKVYVGNELKGENLEIVKNWTSSCSDEEYEAQFEKMVALCQENGYNVTFESVASYLNVNAICDNLRGPSGRGIKNIIVENRTNNNSTGVWTINYDDDSSEIVNILNFYAQDGKDGRDGRDGRDGSRGVSSKLIMIYTSGENGTPNTPKGGSYHFDTNELVCPDGWSRNDSDVKPPIFISTGTFTDSESRLSTNATWDKPIQITGDKGEPGADGISTEFIYCRTKIEPQKPTENDKTINGFVPNGWKASPEGINEDNPTEWVCIRNFNKELKEWGDWEGPNLWGNFGVNGQDGDGIQYIYYKTEKGTPPDNPTPQDYKNIYHLYQDKSLEWVPGINDKGEIDYKNVTSYLNIDGKVIYESIIPILDNNDEPIAYAWTDNPTDVTVEYQYQWVSSRKYRIVDGKKMWDKFSKPVLWGKFGEKGKAATIIRKIYFNGTSTSDMPVPPTSSTDIGTWSYMFPTTDYVPGVNVVWGSEAEVNVDDNTFIEGYVVVSPKGQNPPLAATEENTKYVEELPKIKEDDYEYLYYNEAYYQWKGGWCTPYILTGTKGESATPIDYTTYVFAYGWRNSFPNKPDFTSVDNTNFTDNNGSPCLGQTKDGEDRDVYWYDFPDTSNEKLENDLRRWYQCCGSFHGETNEVKENGWGEVRPCNAEDGKNIEMRFYVTTDYNTPNVNKSKRYPDGWVDINNITEVPYGGAMWQIFAIINPTTDTLMGEWSNPVRITGEKGETGAQGPQGPAGEPGAVGGRGATGLPGVSYINMYCLGTEDIYFGTNNFTDKSEEELKNEGWCGPENIPSAQIFSFNLSSEEEVERYNNFIKNPINLRCVFKKKELNSNEYVYYVLNELEKPIELKEINENIVIKDDFLYLWYTQGIEKFTKKEGDEDVDISTITWGNPFRLQGVNGLKGTKGSRGQVVYPMGIYNQEEVYITTETKAPYVYDPSDGEFYVLNVVNKPWVGKLPDGFENIYTHPSDVTKINTKEVENIPTEKVEDVKYLLYNELYYIWDNNSNSYIEASNKKYQYNGDWLTDQNGDTPTTNYNDETTEGREPAWVKFESFQALYTSIGIIANGMIGSAVYNNEFMFSQQGCDLEGNDSNFAYKKGGFLSAYYYDEKGEVDKNGVKTGRHWMYGDDYIDDLNVNPYAKDENGNYIHNFIPNICMNFKTGQMWAARGQVYNGPTTSSLGDLVDLVDDFKSETETNIENITKGIESVSKEASDVQESLNKLNDELSKSLEDGYLSKDEQVRMEDKLDDLEVQFNELKSEHEDLINNEYLKGNTEDETTPKGKLQGIFNSLLESHDNFVSEIQKLLDVKFVDDNVTYNMRALNNDNTSLRKYKVNLNDYFSNDLGWEYKYADGDWNWDDTPTKDNKPGFKDYQIKYENDLQSYTKEVLITQNFIQEEIKNSIQVGGVNLIEFNKLDNNGYLNFTKQRPKIIVEYNKDDTMPAIKLPNNSVIKKGYEYVLSFNFKKISGTISKVGMPLDDDECKDVQIYIDNTLYPLNTGSDASFTVDYTADNYEHKVIIKFKTTWEVQYQNIIQFNRKLTTAFKVEVSNIQLEVGNVATEYKPNDADIIEARENILKGGMMVSIIGMGDTVSKDLTTTLKANTEYVFSVENSTNDLSIHLVDDRQSMSMCILNISKNKKNYITFTTPNFTNSKVYLFAEGNDTTLYGIKLAEGNKYTPWEGTADEQKTLIMLNSAMNGSTETNGGLMLTNTIGMKGSTDENNTITAGINGLNTTVSGMESDLRFWAGSNTWEDIQTAPFRVYNDGKVFGTHFYGFHSALNIDNDDIPSNNLIDVKKWGSKILLNLTTNPTNALTFPSGMDYVGAEIEIFNPYNRRIAVCGLNIISPTIATLDNAFENITRSSVLSSTFAHLYTKKEDTSTVTSGDYIYTIPRWSIKNINACAVPSQMPNYMRWKCICFKYENNVYSESKVSTDTYYNRFNQSAYTRFLPLWVLVESSDDVILNLETIS